MWAPIACASGVLKFTPAGQVRGMTVHGLAITTQRDVKRSCAVFRIDDVDLASCPLKNSDAVMFADRIDVAGAFKSQTG